MQAYITDAVFNPFKENLQKVYNYSSPTLTVKSVKNRSVFNNATNAKDFYD